MNIEVIGDGVYGLSSLSKKTRESCHLQMLLERQPFLLSYLKTLSVGPAGVLNPLPPAQLPDARTTETTGQR